MSAVLAIATGALLGLVVQDAPPSKDARLSEVRTLDSYHPFDPPATRAGWAVRRDVVRRQVLVAAGLWPVPPRVSFETIYNGVIERDGYTVERIAFQALPDFWVTGNLYRPTAGSGPYPAVLCPHGHWDRGRFTVISEEEARAQIERGEERYLANARHHLQARCAELARRGAIVLHWDMIGYADSRQLDHREGFGDVEAELWGMSHFGLQTLSSIRALDWMLAREDVDPERVAVTGGSGGGTQTFILGAVDDRPAALFPAVMVSTGMQGGCVCENASLLRVGSGNVELAAMAAPRPLGLTGADDWTREIMTRGLPELEVLYDHLGAPENVRAWCYEEHPHNYNLVARRHLYSFLAEHVGLTGGDADEAELVPIDPSELGVWTAEHPRPEDAADLAGVRQSWMQLKSLQVEATIDLVDEDPAEFRRIVRGALEVVVGARPPSEVAVLSDVEGQLVLSPEGAGHRVRLQVGSRGEAPVTVLEVASSSDAEPPGVAAARTAVVYPLGLDGARLPSDSARHGRNVGYTWGYNTTLLTNQVQDVLTAVVYLAGREGRPVRLLGRGDALPATLLAAVLADGLVERVAVVGDFGFDQVTSLDDPRMLPRALGVGGLGSFAALLAPRYLWWSGGELPDVVLRAYSDIGAMGALVREAEAAGAGPEEWLTR